MKCLLLILAMLLTGCASLKAPRYPQRILPSLSEARAECDSFVQDFRGTRAYMGTLNVLWYSIPMMLVVKTEADSLQAFATTVNGMTFYSAQCKKGVIKVARGFCVAEGGVYAHPACGR